MLCNMGVGSSYQLELGVTRTNISHLSQLLEKFLPQADHKDIINVELLCVYFRLHIINSIPTLHCLLICIFPFVFHSKHHLCCTCPLLFPLFSPGLHLSLHPSNFFSSFYFFFLNRVFFLILFVLSISIISISH